MILGCEPDVCEQNKVNLLCAFSWYICSLICSFKFLMNCFYKYSKRIGKAWRKLICTYKNKLSVKERSWFLKLPKIFSLKLNFKMEQCRSFSRKLCADNKLYSLMLPTIFSVQLLFLRSQVTASFVQTRRILYCPLLRFYTDFETTQKKPFFCAINLLQASDFFARMEIL